MRINKLTYGFYAILHPFKGFWDIKYEGRGSLPAALAIVAAYVLTSIFRQQLSGYIFNTNYPRSVNAFLIAMQILVLYFLWCLSNWCLTTLMDGEGNLTSILTAIGYCLLPLIFANILTTLLSNVLSMQEGMFLQLIDGLAYLWFGLLILFSTAVVQQYSLRKTLVTSALTIGVMMAIVFIVLLCVSLAQQLSFFIDSIYKEIAYRI